MECKDRYDRQMKKWEETRKHKWNYVFRFGVLYWGIPVGFATYLWDLSFDITLIELPTLALRLFVFMVIGVVFGYTHFNMNEQRFKRWQERFGY